MATYGDYYENQNPVSNIIKSVNRFLQRIIAYVIGFLQHFFDEPEDVRMMQWKKMYYEQLMHGPPVKYNDLKLLTYGELIKGDILISKSGFFSGMIGHAAIMATDEWVVEMPGGGGSSRILSSSSPGPNETLEDNNRRISIDNWLNQHRSDSVTVYRCPDYQVACMAANWAYKNYYNASGGDEKTIHINYSLVSPILRETDPSYCSKLVIQAFYYGTGPYNVISLEVMVKGAAIVPSQIPSFFTPKYKLEIVQKF